MFVMHLYDGALSSDNLLVCFRRKAFLKIWHGDWINKKFDFDVLHLWFYES